MSLFNALGARADLSRLLSACYYQPGPEFAEEKLFDSIVAAVSTANPQLVACAKRLRDAYDADSSENLLIDYTRLFLGPTGALSLPYGSVWLGQRKELMQNSTLAVLDMYAEGGFEIDEQFRELPDHISAELEFLYLLIFREAQARLHCDRGAQQSISGLRWRFLQEHLARWIGPFSAAIRRGAQSEFYGELAALTEGFIAAEAERGLQISDKSGTHEDVRE